MLDGHGRSIRPLSGEEALVLGGVTYYCRFFLKAKLECLVIGSGELPQLSGLYHCGEQE